MRSASLAVVAPLVSRRSGRIRPFVEADIAQVAHVHQQAFRIQDAPSLESYRHYFSAVFLQNPSRSSAISSLVHEEQDGRVTGFVGLVPRRAVLNGRTYQAVISSQFIVDPASHVALVALRLAKAYLDGPQDLSIADEANEVSRRIWEGLGGVTSWLDSMYWTRPLRPARLGNSYLRQRPGMATLAAATRPLAAAIDALAARLPGSQLRQLEPDVDAAELTAHDVVTDANACCDPTQLRIEHDERTFEWLVDRARRHTPDGRLLTAVIKDGSTITGWYIAHLDRDGAAEVAQLSAHPSAISGLIDHLFYEAWRHGAVTVGGRLEPRLMQVLSDKYCLFHRRGPWVLIKAKAPELLHAIQSGAASLSRLDGEWSLRYQA